MSISVELAEREVALVIQAISEVRLAADFTPDEQLALKKVAEKLAHAQGHGDDYGTETGD